MKKMITIIILLLLLLFLVGSIWFNICLLTGDRRLTENNRNTTSQYVPKSYDYNDLASDLIQEQQLSTSRILNRLSMTFIVNNFEKVDGYYDFQAKIEKTSRYIIKMINFIDDNGGFELDNEDGNYDIMLRDMRTLEGLYIGYIVVMENDTDMTKEFFNAYMSVLEEIDAYEIIDRQIRFKDYEERINKIKEDYEDK